MCKDQSDTHGFELNGFVRIHCVVIQQGCLIKTETFREMKDRISFLGKRKDQRKHVQILKKTCRKENRQQNTSDVWMSREYVEKLSS